MVYASFQPFSIGLSNWISHRLWYEQAALTK